MLAAFITIASPALARTVRVVALGDSLTAGYGVGPKEAFPVQLEAALRARGHDVVIENAGVSGETATQGLARLDWSVPQGTDAVIVALGANDMLRGLPPKVTRAAVTQIVERLKARGIRVLVAGMRAAPNLGAAYAGQFDPIFPEVAGEQGVLLYPFFLEGVAGDPALNQKDGLHPNPRGVAVMVEGILPKAEDLLAQVNGAGATPPAR
ncbi:arylesterase [Xanthobacter sp. V0B-10]|uniref:arylesterase n=1 Tax=Xanthobacter albus TaxID=3119929 RepID=UPI003727D81E